MQFKADNNINGPGWSRDTVTFVPGTFVSVVQSVVTGVVNNLWSAGKMISPQTLSSERAIAMSVPLNERIPSISEFEACLTVIRCGPG